MKLIKNITEQILDEFKDISKYPRPSKHEEAIANYLIGLGKRLSLESHKDKSNNVIIEKPASQGYENAPTTILQCHSDMIVAVADEANFDPLTDTVKIVRQGNTLTARNTSLGADNGIGMAMIITILKDKILKHGPIRAIFTSDEETGLYGAKGINPKHFVADYLINIDTERVAKIVNGSGGVAFTTYEFDINATKPKLSNAYEIKVHDLSGGHSGSDIHLRRANAIKVMVDILRQIDSNLNIELGRFDGGFKFNAIPDKATATIIIDQGEESKLQELLKKATEFNKNFYLITDPNMQISLSEQQLPKTVFADESKHKLLDILDITPHGVIFSDHYYNYVEDLSVNLGVVETFEHKIKISSTVRAGLNELFHINSRTFKIIANAFGVDIVYTPLAPLWAPRGDSKLVNTMLGVSKKQGVSDVTVTPLHGGLECAQFLEYNPKLDLASVGPTIHDPHTIYEKLMIDTIEPTYNMIIGTLEQLK